MGEQVFRSGITVSKRAVKSAKILIALDALATDNKVIKLKKMVMERTLTDYQRVCS